MRTVCQPITACSQDLGNPAGRLNTIGVVTHNYLVYLEMSSGQSETTSCRLDGT